MSVLLLLSFVFMAKAENANQLAISGVIASALVRSALKEIQCGSHSS